MNWTIGRWSDVKIHAKFCLPDKKESRSCIGLWQAMKSGSIFRILNARNLGLIPPNPSTSSSRPNRMMLCVWWDQQGVIYYELLKPDETVNAHRYHQQLHQIALCSAALAEKTWQADFPPWHRTIAYVNNDPKLLGDTQLGSATPSHLLTRPGTFLSPVFVDGPRARWAALRFCEDIRKWLDEWFASKDEKFFWHGVHKLSEMGKMYS